MLNTLLQILMRESLHIYQSVVDTVSHAIDAVTQCEVVLSAPNLYLVHVRRLAYTTKSLWTFS